jgi:hypothetical protein
MFSFILFEVFRFWGGHSVGVLREAKYNEGFEEGAVVLIYSGDGLRLNFLGQ